MEMNEDDIIWARETIRKTELFADFDAAQIDILLDGLEKSTYHAGATILFQGEISSRLCLVQTGKVEVVMRRGKEKVHLAEIGPAGFFGEISLLTPRAATATVRALVNADIIFLHGETVQNLVKTNHALAERINQRIEERLASHTAPQDTGTPPAAS